MSEHASVRITAAFSSPERKDMTMSEKVNEGSAAAFGVLRVGGGWVSIVANEVQAETSCKSFDKMENWVHEAIPLYRSPSLTEAERDALNQAVFTLREICDATCDSAADTLRSLLERTK